MSSRDQDQVAWITGASSGIGEALALELARGGARLALSSNETEPLEQVAGQCRQAGSPQVEALFLDLARAETMPEQVRTVLERFGHVDLLVNNGGISQRALACDTPLEIDRKVMEIDYFGHVALTKALLPSMRERRSGHIVVTTSVLGLMGAPTRSAYCAAKHALHGFFESLAYELWKEGIRVTMVAPAAVQTQIDENALTATGARHGRKDRMVQAGITPELAARQILEAVRKGKDLVVPGGGRGWIGVTFKRLMPGIYAWTMKRYRLL